MLQKIREGEGKGRKKKEQRIVVINYRKSSDKIVPSQNFAMCIYSLETEIPCEISFCKTFLCNKV